MVSRRVQSVDSSGIRKVFDLAAKLKDPINLSIGQPDYDAFDEVKEGAIAAINAGKNSYTLTQGIPELREALRKRYDLPSELDCFVTSGVSGGILLSYLTLLDPEDEILVPDPFFVMYPHLAKLINAVPKYYNTYPDFRIGREELERQVTARTKALIVASPGNPTGIALSQSEVDSLIDFCRTKGVWLIFDEIYEAFSYDHAHPRVLGKYEKTILLSGFSKSHGITGWRVGAAVGPKDVVQQMLKLQQYTFVCAPSMAQWGVLAGFNRDFSETLAEYRRKRDFMVTALSERFKLIKPGGAFYLFPEAPGGSGQRFVERCIENNLLVVPGNVFSNRDSHFRISFSAPMQRLEQGAEILNRLANEY